MQESSLRALDPLEVLLLLYKSVSPRSSSMKEKSKLFELKQSQERHMP
jgi:hypothetical protein